MLLENNLQGGQHVGIPVADLDRAVAWYTNTLGFQVIHTPTAPSDEGEVKVAFLQSNDMVIECYQLLGKAREEILRRQHGHIDHITLDVLDIEQALQMALNAGAELDSSTPNGVVFLEQFWSKGAKYVMLKGPMGEKVELNQRLDASPSRRTDMFGGWSHLGIPVTNIEESLAFYHRFGFKTIMTAEIPEHGDVVRAAMIEKDRFVIELYQLVGADREEIASRKDGHIDHIAFTVVDVDRAYAELCAEGFAPLESSPVRLDFWEKGYKYFNIRGPVGEKLEFGQAL